MSTTTHPLTPEEIMAFVDGELPPDRAETFSDHLGSCAECSDLGKQLRSTSQALTEWRVGEPSSLIQERILAEASGAPSFSGDGRTLFPRLRVLLSRPLPWAVACLALLVVMSAQLFRSRSYNFMGPAPSYRSVMEMKTYRPSAPPSRPVAPPSEDSDAARQSRYGDSASDADSLSSASTSLATSAGRATVRNQTGQDEGRVGIKAPMIARVVSLSIVAKDFDASRTALEAILARHNGYAAELNVATPQGAGKTIQASLRIPAPQLAAVMSELKALGRVENETQNGEEVTQQHADLIARLKNSRETEHRLQDVLRTRTGKVKDVLEVEEEIARVRGEIEQMEAEQQTLEHRVNFATIDLKLAEEYKAQLSSPAPTVGMQLRNATVNGFRNASETLLGIVLFLAESVPTLLLWMLILLFPVRLIWKRYKRQLALS